MHVSELEQKIKKIQILKNSLSSGSADKSALDCRTIGCGKGAECIRDGPIFVCRCPPGSTGSPDVECKTG